MTNNLTVATGTTVNVVVEDVHYVVEAQDTQYIVEIDEQDPNNVYVTVPGLQGPAGPSNVWVAATPPPSTSMVWVDTSP